VGGARQRRRGGEGEGEEEEKFILARSFDLGGGEKV
jgi:hypothetical protein